MSGPAGAAARAVGAASPPPPAAAAAQAAAFKMVVLALIHLNGGSLPVDELWRHVGHGLGAAAEEREHPCFGKPEDLVRDLEKTR